MACLRLLASKPARDTTLCLCRALCYFLVELVNTLVGLGPCLRRYILCLLTAFLKLILGIFLALLELLLCIVGLCTVSFGCSAELPMRGSQLDRTCLRPVAHRLRPSHQLPFLAAQHRPEFWRTPCGHRLEHLVSARLFHDRSWRKYLPSASQLPLDRLRHCRGSSRHHCRPGLVLVRVHRLAISKLLTYPATTTPNPVRARRDMMRDLFRFFAK